MRILVIGSQRVNLLCDLGRQGGVTKFMKNDRF